MRIRGQYPRLTTSNCYIIAACPPISARHHRPRRTNRVGPAGSRTPPQDGSKPAEFGFALSAHVRDEIDCLSSSHSCREVTELFSICRQIEPRLLPHATQFANKARGVRVLTTNRSNRFICYSWDHVLELAIAVIITFVLRKRRCRRIATRKRVL